MHARSVEHPRHSALMWMILAIVAGASHVQADHEHPRVRLVLRGVGVDVAPDDDAIEALVAYARTETDSWNLDRLARGIVGVEEATPLFREWSREASPMLRYRAIVHAGASGEGEALGYLRDLWRRPAPPWMRAAMIRALDHAGEDFHAIDCAGLVLDADDDLASAAVACVVRHEVAAALPLLARRAIEGTDCTRKHAFDGLVRMLRATSVPSAGVTETLAPLTDDDQPPWLRARALDALDLAGSDRSVAIAKRWMRAAEPALVEQAIVVLERHRSADLLDLLVERASTGDAAARVTAIGALGRQALTSEVARVLNAATRSDEPERVRRIAIETMSDVGWRPLVANSDEATSPSTEPTLDRATFLPRLRDLARTDPDEDVRAYAERVAERLEEGIYVVELGCGSRSDRCDLAMLDPIAPAKSVRCRPAPGVEADPGESMRIDATGPVHPYDRYWDGTSMWRAIAASGRHKTCWVPEERLRPIRIDEPKLRRAEVSVREFDLPIERARSESFATLAAWGLVRTFDPGDAWIGASLSIDPDDAIGLEILRRATEWADTPLGDAVRAMLSEIEGGNGSLEGWDAWIDEGPVADGKRALQASPPGARPP